MFVVWCLSVGVVSFGLVFVVACCVFFCDSSLVGWLLFVVGVGLRVVVGIRCLVLLLVACCVLFVVVCWSVVVVLVLFVVGCLL